MVNTKAIGWRNMDKCRKRMQFAGYLVDTVEKTGRFCKQKDLFGLFDLFCIKKGSAVLIQITTNKNHGHKPYLQFSKDYHNNGIEFQQWVWYNRRGWRMFNYRMGMKIETDERKKK